MLRRFINLFVKVVSINVVLFQKKNKQSLILKTSEGHGLSEIAFICRRDHGTTTERMPVAWNAFVPTKNQIIVVVLFDILCRHVFSIMAEKN